MADHARRLTISGRVQGVFYRDWTVQQARELGLAGWVCNELDGTVAVLLEGSQDIVAQMIERLQTGPAAAEVAGIEEQPVEPLGLETFERR